MTTGLFAMAQKRCAAAGGETRAQLLSHRVAENLLLTNPFLLLGAEHEWHRSIRIAERRVSCPVAGAVRCW